MLKFRLKIKSYFINKKINALSHRSTLSTNRLVKKISRVGIITTNNLAQRYDFTEILVQKFQLRNPKIYSYRKFSKYHQKSYKHFSENDFNWKGAIIDPSFQNFLEEHFDLLICFFSKKSIFLEYAVASSNAAFKVGLSKVDTSFFHLDINCDTAQVELFFDELRKYLEIFGKI